MGLSMEKSYVYRLLAGRGAGVFRGNVARKTGALCGRSLTHAIFTAAVNFWYRRKTFRYLTEMGIDKGVTRELNR